MKFTIFFIYVPLVSSGIHNFITTYIGIRGKTTEETPEFFTVSTLDGHQIDYYDSNIIKLIPKRPWMKEFISEEQWSADTEIRRQVQQIYKNNIPVLMQRFNQSDGVHTYQRMYGCEWDDETKESRGFDEYGYDGEDFLILDVKQLRYITPVAQGLPTAQKWSDNTAQLEFLKRYYSGDCVKWLKKFLMFGKEDLLERTAPEVFLLQKDPYSPVSCLATGFYPSGVTITWLRNGQEHDKHVDLGELLPNEDGTFQKTSTLRVTSDEWKQNQYTCEVEHQGKTFWKTLTVDDIKSNYKLHVIMLWCVMGVFIILFALTAVIIFRKKQTHRFKPVPCNSDEVVLIDKGL